MTTPASGELAGVKSTTGCAPVAMEGEEPTGSLIPPLVCVRNHLPLSRGTTRVDKTAYRLKLLANGYTPLIIAHKTKTLRNWPRIEPTIEMIRDWGRMSWQGTAIVLRDDLTMIDLDIGDQDIVDAIGVKLRLYLNIDPLVRYGSSTKEAWLVRCSEPFARIASRVWHPAGEPERGYQCEIYSSGGQGRYFGVDGPHTLNPDGSVAVDYRWLDKGPDEVPVDQLPVLTKAQLLRCVEIVNEVFIAKGWVAETNSRSGEYGGEHEYDLSYDMTFDLDDGTSVDLVALCKMAEADPNLDRRCSASFIDGPAAKNRQRCRIHSRNGRPSIHVFGTADTHHPEEDRPDPVGDLEDTLANLAALPFYFKHRPRPDAYQDLPRPARGDRLDRAVGKLIQSYAFVSGGDSGAIYMGAASLSETMSMAGFRDKMRPWAEMRPALTPTGRETTKLMNPADMWLSDRDRVTVDGLVSAPGKPTPTFEEDGKLLINAYRPPVHELDGMGNTDVFWEFLEHLFPDPAEQLYFIRWLGHKVRNPHIPGPSIISVAEEFGTGRTTLGQIIERLFGQRYVAELDFRSISGETSQSQYNGWAATAVMVLVDESSETQGAQYKQRRNAYEALKRHCDPRPVKRQITIKGKNNYQATTCTTFFIATNHTDAISLPPDDRRFAVLSNGRRLDADLATRLNRWLLDDSNIALLYHQLRLLDLGDYSPYAEPIRTAAKARMADEAKSDLERAVAIALTELRSPVVTMSVLTRFVMNVASEHSFSLPGVTENEREANVSRIAKRYLIAVQDEDKYVRAQINGKRQVVYAVSEADAKAAARMDPAFLTRDVKKNLENAPATMEEKLATLHHLPTDTEKS